MKHTTVRLPESDHAALERNAEREGRTVAQEIRLAIRDRVNWITGSHIDKHEGKGER